MSREITFIDSANPVEADFVTVFVSGQPLIGLNPEEVAALEREIDAWRIRRAQRVRSDQVFDEESIPRP